MRNNLTQPPKPPLTDISDFDPPASADLTNATHQTKATTKDTAAQHTHQNEPPGKRDEVLEWWGAMCFPKHGCHQPGGSRKLCKDAARMPGPLSLFTRRRDHNDAPFITTGPTPTHTNDGSAAATRKHMSVLPRRQSHAYAAYSVLYSRVRTPQQCRRIHNRPHLETGLWHVDVGGCSSGTQTLPLTLVDCRLQHPRCISSQPGRMDPCCKRVGVGSQ